MKRASTQQVTHNNKKALLKAYDSLYLMTWKDHNRNYFHCSFRKNRLSGKKENWLRKKMNISLSDSSPYFSNVIFSSQLSATRGTSESSSITSEGSRASFPAAKATHTLEAVSQDFLLSFNSIILWYFPSISLMMMPLYLLHWLFCGCIFRSILHLHEKELSNPLFPLPVNAFKI